LQTDRINALIDKAKNRCQEIIHNVNYYGKSIDITSFMAEYNSESVSKKSFTDFFKKSIDLETDKAYNTVRGYKSTFNYFKEFRINVDFGQLTYECVEAFDKFLRKKNCDTNTLHKHHKNVKKFINLAINKGNKIINPYASFKVRKIETEIEYLDFSDLKKLIEIYDKGDLEHKLLKVLRYFLFSATCNGLRYSDVAQLTPDDVHGDMLVFTPVKTKGVRKSLTVPLSKKGKAFIQDALDDRQRIRKTIFTVISNQKTNEAMAKVAKIAGINKRCNFHSARHTFATHFLAKNKDVATLQKLMGHADIKTTMKYVHISHEIKIEQMRNFDELFSF
jgi:integrase/recombinase XerD